MSEGDSIQIVRFTTCHGEAGELRMWPDGRWLCPICAAELSGEPAYSTAVGLPDTNGPAYASHDICPTCNVEYGCDDQPRKGETLMERWHRLRRKWLDRTGWRAEDLGRLARNLDIRLTPPERSGDA